MRGGFSIVEVDYCACRVVWHAPPAGPLVRRILISGARREMIAESCSDDQDAPAPPAIHRLCGSIDRALNGLPTEFDLDILDLSACTAFQIEVLQAARRIPLGQVASYGDIAEDIGAPRAVRAVGTALARNPFPVAYPCHRIVRSDGKSGGYIAGETVKMELLRREGCSS